MRNNTDTLFEMNVLKSKNKRHGSLLKKKKKKKKKKNKIVLKYHI